MLEESVIFQDSIELSKTQTLEAPAWKQCSTMRRISLGLVVAPLSGGAFQDMLGLIATLWPRRTKRLMPPKAAMPRSNIGSGSPPMMAATCG
jgi:hypothetical protein